MGKGRSFDLAAMMETVSSLEPAAPEERDIETITSEILTLKQNAGDAIIGIGQRLMEAKALLPHGSWLPWLEDRVELSERTARNFMRLAREWTNRQALADLGAAKALTLLALPPEERERFIAEDHVVNEEEKNVIDMTTRELEQALRERDEAQRTAEAAKAAARTAEESRAKMEEDMRILQSRFQESESAAGEACGQLDAVRRELEELRAKPVEVAVMAVDQEKLDQARAEAISEMQAKVDRAKAARDKAEAARKAAEEALSDANAKLEAAARAEKKAVISSDRDLAAFELLFEQAQEIANKLHGLLIKARSQEDGSHAAGMQKALAKLAELIGKAEEV